MIDPHCAFNFTDAIECISLIWTLYVFLVCEWMHVWVHVCVHLSMHVFEANRQPRLSFLSYLPYMWERGPRALQVGLTGSPVSPRDPLVSASPGLGLRPHTTSPGLHILWFYSIFCPFLLHCFCIIEFWVFFFLCLLDKSPLSSLRAAKACQSHTGLFMRCRKKVNYFSTVFFLFENGSYFLVLHAFISFVIAWKFSFIVLQKQNVFCIDPTHVLGLSDLADN